jgi:hypothetical protein
MLPNCSRSTAFTSDCLNCASGLEFHRFHWLEAVHMVWAVSEGRHHLGTLKHLANATNASLLYWILGGLCLSEQRTMDWVIWPNVLLPAMKLFCF